jgi:tRNA(Arg) A34 adenosine deaminase TadA
MTMEDQLIRNIEAGIRGIRFGTKTPQSANVGNSLNRLKDINIGMYEDLIEKYKTVVSEYNKKNLDKSN